MIARLYESGLEAVEFDKGNAGGLQFDDKVAALR